MSGPRCPNHDVLLQLTNDRGIGICPVSGAEFFYVPDDKKGKPEYENVIKNGKIVRQLKQKYKIVSGSE